MSKAPTQTRNAKGDVNARILGALRSLAPQGQGLEFFANYLTAAAVLARMNSSVITRRAGTKAAKRQLFSAGRNGFLFFKSIGDLRAEAFDALEDALQAELGRNKRTTFVHDLAYTVRAIYRAHESIAVQAEVPAPKGPSPRRKRPH